MAWTGKLSALIFNLHFFWRVTKQAAEIVQTANTKTSKRPETIFEEPEPAYDPANENWSGTGTQRPPSPQIPPSPRATPQKRPSSSPQRPLTPSSAPVQPVAFIVQRPGSDPQLRRSRPVSPTSSGSIESLSPTLLEIPPVQLSEKVDQLTQDEVWDWSPGRKGRGGGGCLRILVVSR